MAPSEIRESEISSHETHHRRLRSRELFAGLVIILLVTTAGSAIILQGWKSRIPFVDLTPPIDDAFDLLSSGVVPQWGRVNSLGSYASPGSSWLVMPGLVLFSDPRLFEYVAAIMLYFGTLAGIFLSSRIFFSFKCSVLSVLLYGFSELGLYFAGSLWPKGHPFFYIWTVYFAIAWAKYRNVWFLAGAIVVMSAGIYVHMEVAPIILVVLLVWLICRSPIHLFPVFVAVATSTLIWLPYLMFEYNRNFYDVVSQITQRSQWGYYKGAWCDPSSKMIAIQDTIHEVPHKTIAMSQLVPENSAVGIFGNFYRALRFFGVPDVLFFLTAVSIAILLSRAVCQKSASAMSLSPAKRSEGGPESWLIALLLIIPWIFLLYVTKDARYLVETRFWWLWPVQIIVLAALVTDQSRTVGISVPVARVGQVILAILIMLNPLTMNRISKWITSGWSGTDSYEKQVVDFIASQVTSEGKTNVAIGYEISFNGWLPTQHILDTRMKVGMELDLLFRFIHGIHNNTRCAEGTSPADEYRIVQTDRSSALRYPFNFDDGLPRYLFVRHSGERFQTINRLGPYLVRKRIADGR